MGWIHPACRQIPPKILRAFTIFIHAVGATLATVDLVRERRTDCNPSVRKSGVLTSRKEKSMKSSEEGKASSCITLLFSLSAAHCTAILRGLTVSAFGNVTVRIPWSIFAVIFVASIDGASS